MKDNPTPTLPLSGEGVKPQSSSLSGENVNPQFLSSSGESVKPQSSPLSGDGVKPQSFPSSGEGVKPQSFRLSGDGVNSPSAPPVSRKDVKTGTHDVKTVAVDERNAAETEQYQNTTPSPDKEEAGSNRTLDRILLRTTPPPDKGEAGRGLKHPRLHNLKSQRDNRRHNRKNPTEPEQRFWSWVRGKQLGCKFRRQHGIGKYIVDFYCAEYALIIELDGDSHYTREAMAYDQERTDYLIAKGFTVLRFTNLEVMHNKDGVLRAVLPYLETRGDHEENS